MRILVTGGAGFIGSHLCEALLEIGNEVICVDNFFTGSKKNVEHLLDNKNFELIRHDITQPLFIEVDQIYNLACPGAPIHYQRRPAQTIKASTVGMFNMLELAKRCDAKILQASTSEVYGDPQEHPQTEEYWGNVNPIGKRACYDEGKRVAEALMISYRDEFGVDIRIARIFNTYGSRLAFNDGRVVSNFIIQALRNEPITVYGDGMQTRSFCHVSDTVKGLIDLMNKYDYVNSPINIGNPGEVSIGGLAMTIKEMTKSRSKVITKDLPDDDPVRRQPDITKMKRDFNWEPKVDLEQGLKETIKWFKENI